MVLAANDVSGVKMGRVSGSLTDHYDPRTKTINLSDTVYDKTSVAAIGVAKLKTATLMVGLTLKLFYDLPISLLINGVSDVLLIIAAVLSIISGAKYYMMAREYITDK